MIVTCIISNPKEIETILAKLLRDAGYVRIGENTFVHEGGDQLTAAINYGKTFLPEIKDVRDCLNPKRADNIDYVLKRIDEDLERVREHPSYDELREEAKLVKERVKTEGSSAASVMYFFGKKKKE